MEESNQKLESQESFHFTQDTEIVSVDVICRLCANQSDRTIGIYSEEGIYNDLSNKMNLYLPIKVTETDNLPLQCCWTCASTVLAWHELVVASVEADRRLRNELVFETISTSEMKSLEINENSLEHYNDVLPENNSEDENDGISMEESDLNISDAPELSHQSDSHTSKSQLNKPRINSSFVKSEVVMTNNTSETDEKNESLFEEIKNEATVERNREGKVKKKRNIKKRTESGSIKKEFLVNTEDIEICEVHNVNEDNEETIHYICPFCAKVAYSKEEIFQHVLDEHKDVKSWNEVKNISKSKTSKKRLTKSEQEIVNEAKMEVDGRVYYNCKECGKSLFSPYTFLWHMRIHTGERPFVCDLCGKQFRVSQGLVRHVRETHEGVKNYPCDLCGRMFASRRNVEEHRRIHTNERPYVCDHCGKTFKQKASLFVHNRSHTPDFKFRCSYCNQGFRARGPLLLHITKHTGVKPYTCETCGRSFRIKYELKRHQLIHSDNKPFCCKECNMTFRQKRYLKNHMKVNHNQIII